MVVVEVGDAAAVIYSCESEFIKLVPLSIQGINPNVSTHVTLPSQDCFLLAAAAVGNTAYYVTNCLLMFTIQFPLYNNLTSFIVSEVVLPGCDIPGYMAIDQQTQMMHFVCQDVGVMSVPLNWLLQSDDTQLLPLLPTSQCTQTSSISQSILASNGVVYVNCAQLGVIRISGVGTSLLDISSPRCGASVVCFNPINGRLYTICGVNNITLIDGAMSIQYAVNADCETTAMAIEPYADHDVLYIGCLSHWLRMAMARPSSICCHGHHVWNVLCDVLLCLP